MNKYGQRKLERAVAHLPKDEREEVLKTSELIDTDQVKGLVRLEDYIGSDINLQGWKLTGVLDDILMCVFADINEDGTMIKRGDLWVPLNAGLQAWRVARVIFAGPRAKVKPGQHVIFPSTFGLKASNINDLKHIVFLNEDRIFGIAEPVIKESVAKKP